MAGGALMDRMRRNAATVAEPYGSTPDQGMGPHEAHRVECVGNGADRGQARYTRPSEWTDR